MFNRRALTAAIALGFFLIALPTYAQDKSIVVASTTSTQDSGLFEYLLPIFKQKTGITVKVLAQGTYLFTRSKFDLRRHIKDIFTD